MRIAIVLFVSWLPFATACHKDGLSSSNGGADMTVIATNDLGLGAHDMATGTADMTLNQTIVDMTFNGDGHVCTSTTSSCPQNGVPCGTSCCQPGEWCDSTLKCNCGNAPCPTNAQYVCGSIDRDHHFQLRR